MVRINFDRDWTVGRRTSLFEEVSGSADQERAVTLPHDAMIGLQRGPEHGGAENAYFPSGAIQYTKTFEVPADYRQKRLTLEFEGVYRDAQVYVNGVLAGHRANGYALFRVPIDAFVRFGEPNEVRVEARTHDDSRWYSGMGIHRGVSLLVTDAVHIAHDGIRLTTPDIDAERAVVVVATDIANDTPHTVTVQLTSEVEGEAGASSEIPVTIRPGVTTRVRQRLYVRSPRLWSPDEPNLYTVKSSIGGGGASESRATTLGIRSLQLDPKHGLRINGIATKLRGACLHHDNGILGAAAIPRAEERRIEILKSAGFNAIRASHNPLSVAMLDACDRLGMIVMDEAFDMWTHTKMPFDYALAFPEWWQRDLESMVLKDINHPSVIFYSIGNEIPEVGKGLGAALSREIAEATRELDPTRFVTNAVNGLLAVMSDLAAMAGPGAEGGINTQMTNMGDVMNMLSASELVTERTREVQSGLDVAGMNYAEARYELDRDLFPDRIIVGTETFPTKIAENWPLIERSPNVLGEFTWTGWDYLGEVGIGRARSESDAGAGNLLSGFPGILAGCGDVDITGHRRPVSFFREIVFGLRFEPYIAVDRPERFGHTMASGPWAWTDSVSSWAWDLSAGTPVRVEVYSPDDEVELRLNGRLLGKRAAGPANGFRAAFDVPFEAGELVATGLRNGTPTSSTTLRSAAPDRAVVLRSDRDEILSDTRDLAFIEITVQDAAGTVAVRDDVDVTVTVEGGELQAVGSARPDNVESFAGETHRTYDGRLLAAVRPTGAGRIVVTAADGNGRTDSIEIRVKERAVEDASS